MADVFISYAREESARADDVRRALEALGLSVFFDVERLDAGEEWSDVLDHELKSAGAVVALWSPHALSRPWVRKECAVAQARGVLLPALLEPVSDLDMPVQFSDLQRVDLSDFHGESDHPGWRKLVRALAKTLKRNDLLASQIAALKEEKQTAKVKAELEAAQKQLAQLRKSKGGVKPGVVAAGLVLLLALGGAGAWWGLGEMNRREAEAVKQTRASIVDPGVIKTLAAITDEQKANGDYQDIIEAALQKTKLSRLIEASPVDADAALLAGAAFDYGVGTSKDKAEAAVHYRRACDLGGLIGCEYLGIALAEGGGVAKDYTAALALFDKACVGGVANACSDTGIMYQRGWGIAKDAAKATSYFHQACGKGSMSACVNIGNDFRDAAPPDGAQAISFYGKACDSKFMEGCYALAKLYDDGAAVPHDIAKALLFYTTACDGKYFPACNNLAQLYDAGDGVVQDHAKAVSLLDIACADKMPLACFNLGTMVDLGIGAAKDPARSKAAFTKALSLYEGFCEDGSASDCWNVGKIYEDGHGVEKNPAKAAAAFATGCKLGDRQSCSKAPPAAAPSP